MPGATPVVLAVALDAAMAAHYQPPQEPLVRLTSPWTEVGVITSDALRSLKEIFADDGRHRDLNPLLGGSKLETGALATGCRW